MSTTNFYFGRIHFDHQLESLDDFPDSEDYEQTQRVRELLYEYISNNKPFESVGGNEWRFGRAEKTNGYILGKLGRVYPDERQQFDDEVGDFIEEEDVDTDVSFFIIIPEEQIIIFNRKLRIGQTQFIDAFTDGYRKFYDLEDGLTITLLKDTVEVQRLLSEASRIFFVEFDLIPTNPEADEEMQIIDDRIHEMGADRVGISAESEDELDADDPWIRSGFAMSNGGYGEYKVGYEKDGEEEEYNSRNRPATYETDEPDTLGGLKSKVGEIQERMETILSRGERDEE